ncbi:hypothetical protein LTR53_011557, partial [Teratosphaeriaceae sp. CCFEE 6253]
ECLRRIAARLCALDEHDRLATAESSGVDLGTGDPSGSAQTTQVCCESSEATACGAEKADPTSCCDGKGFAGEAPSCTVDNPRATGCAADQASVCPPSPSPGLCEKACCEPAPGPETPGGCVDECCDLLDRRETGTSASSACSTHLDAAFRRFEAMIKQQLCICRKVVEQLGFCCCLLTSDGGFMESGACGEVAVPRAEGLKVEGCRGKGGMVAVGKGVCSSRSTSATQQANLVDDGCRDRSWSTECTKVACATDRGTTGDGRKCGDSCCTTADTKPATPGKSTPDPTVLAPTIDPGNNVDVEKSAALEHVVLSVAGMTCTGCGNKVRNVLEQIPGLSRPAVTFVSGTAAFELDGDAAKMDEVLGLIEKRTGFKCSRIVDGYLDLEMCDVSPDAAMGLGGREGVVSVAKIKARVHRVTYNPLVVGARDLMPLEATLAAPAADLGVSEGRMRLLHLTSYVALAAMLTIPVAVLNWAPNPISTQTRGITSLLLATAVQAIAIPEFYTPALKSLIFSKVVEMDMLVVISITAAYAYSVVAFALTTAGTQLEQEAFFETGALLITLVLFGRLIAAIARARAIRAVSLQSLQADTTLLLLPHGETREVDSRLLHFGDTVVIRPHSRIVTDGTVISGVSAVDESMLTGEAVPVTRQKGDSVIAGTLNGEGILHLRVTRLTAANSITDIAQSVAKALAAKPRVQDLADRVAAWFVPVVVGIAVVAFGVWIAVALRVRGENGGGAVGTAITYAIAVLAISCPCALGLAVPMVLVVAGGVAARAGVVIKAGDVVERGCKVTDVVFDKTGTLTKGDLCVVREEVMGEGIAREEAMGLVRGLVKDDNHPVSKAIAAHLRGGEVDATSLEQVMSVPGSGIQAGWNGHILEAGNPFWLDIQHDPTVTQLLDQGLTSFCLTIDHTPALAFGLESTLRVEAAPVLDILRQRNITPHIVSGDHARAVSAIARTLGVPPEHVASRRLPQQKKDYISALQARGHTVLFCGDGTNDAVALAQADIGVQLGTASDVAGAAADVVLLGGLKGVVTLLDVSARAYACIRFNFVWAAVYNVFAILLAGGAFVKVRVPPAYAGLGEIVSVGPVILAALSLLVGNGRRR